MILSFDLGVKNLSYCVIKKDCTIHDWKVVDILDGNTRSTRVKSISIERCVKYLLTYLQSAPFPDDLEYILIESQPGGGRTANLRMKTLSHCIQTYFIMTFPNAMIKFVSPKRKLELCGGMCTSKSSKVRYQEHKKRAINTVHELVKGTEWEDWYSRLVKRDDAADSYLQARWFSLNVL